MIRGLDDVNIEAIVPLRTPAEMRLRLPADDDLVDRIIRGRAQIQGVLSGRDPRFLVIVGPCSIHDEEAAFEYAERLGALKEQYKDRLLLVMRVYFEKPRTTVGWKGLIYDPDLNGSDDGVKGLCTAREVLLEIGRAGVLCATEFVDPITPQYIADLVSWAAIGARTAESQTHRQLASGLSMPVGFKNGTGNSVQLAVDGVYAAGFPHSFWSVDIGGRASLVKTRGNTSCHIVLRGGSRGPNYGRGDVQNAADLLKRASLFPHLLVDCSHGNSNKDYTKQGPIFRDLLGQRRRGNAVVGAMLESNLNPGSQNLGRDPADLEYGVSITDACVGWDETAELLAEAYETMGSIIGIAAGV